MTTEEPKLSFWTHVAELRKRITTILIAVLIGFGGAYHFSESIFGWLMIPYQNAYWKVYGKEPVMITTGLVESFMVYMKLGFFVGIFLVSPVIFTQLWAFVAPALRPTERKHTLSIVFFATLFFVGGAILGYFGVFPIGFQYFLEVNKGGNIQPLVRMQEYFELSSMMLLIFGCVFEAPLIVLYLVILGILNAKQLITPWRGIIICISIAAAIFSPPDPGSMIMVGAPMLILYALTIVGAFVVERFRTKTKTVVS